MASSRLARASTSIKRRQQTSFKDEDSLEVSVQAVNGQSHHRIDGVRTYSKKLLISPSGKCLPIREEEEEEDEEDEEEERQGGHRPSHYQKETSGLYTPRAFLWFKRQGKDKEIAADEGVLANYHDSYLYGKVVPTIKVRAAIRGGKWSHVLTWMESLAALMLVALYVRSTYTSKFSHVIAVIRVICASFFVADYLVKLYSAPVRLYYIVSFTGIIDLISVLPFFIIWSPWREDDAIPQLMLVLRFLRIIPRFASVVLAENTIGQQIFLMTAYTSGVVFIMAGLLHWVEQKATTNEAKKEDNCGPHGCLSFYHAIYFVIVTISTVGYGDITMKSDWGRAVTLCTILAALLILPMQINNIIELASRRPYGGKFAVRKVVGSRFVIISGNLSYRTVQDFLSEFYHPSHDKDMPAFPLRVVIMAPYKPSFEMKTLLANYKGRVEFIEGTPSKESDLDRVSAKVASAFFLMADRLAVNPDAEDAAQFVRTLCVHRHCGSRVRVIVEMLKPENQYTSILDDGEKGIEIVCPEAIRFQMLARSCYVRGLPTFVTNLFKSGLVISTLGCEPWMQQYYHGLKQEIFPVILPPCFNEEEMLFEEAAEVLYSKLNVILFGLDIMMEDMSREVMLYPKGHKVLSSDVGLVIAEDLWAAEEVSKFGRQGHFLCWKKICKLSSNNKVYRIQESELLQEVKKRRLSHVTIPMHSMSSEFSIANNSSEWLLRSGGYESLWRSGHKSDYQSHIQKLLSAGSYDKNNSLKDSLPRAENSTGGIKRVFSLEAAIDIAMSWPPSLKWEKPDPPVLERRANVIMENLSNRTMAVINLNASHILVCIQGKWPVNIYYFIRHLRLPGLPNPPIVILHPNEPAPFDWGCVGMFEDVYFVKGSPLFELDLVRAGVLQAAKVVILAQRCREDENSDENDLVYPIEASYDTNTILIAETIEHLHHPAKGRIVVELQQESGIHYLRPTFHMNRRSFDPKMYARNRTADYQFSPPYIEGRGFSPAALNFLLYAKFFNRNAVNIAEKFLSEVNVMGTECEEISHQKFDQLPLPTRYLGRTFLELFIDMLRNNDILVLGLYRPAGTCNSIVSYVYTNPVPGDILVGGDLMFVIKW